MKVTIVTTSIKGGAGYAAENLYKGLSQQGVNAGVLTVEVLKNWRTSLFHRLKRWWLVRKFINSNYELVKDAPHFDYFTFPRTGYQEASMHPLIKDTDVINLHWINNMVDYGTFFKKLDKPVIWTLHDTAPFTGGCHYTFGCENYLVDCHNCMQLSARVNSFAAVDNLRLKKTALDDLDPAKTIVISPSAWLKSLSERSAVLGRFRHFHIPNAIDSAIFKPMDRVVARQKFNLAADKFVVLFVGTSLSQTRKGFDLVLQLMQMLRHRNDIVFVAIGGSDVSYDEVINLGYISNKEEIAAACNAADLYLIPSRQDNLPNTMLEALCCGTPVIGHNIGGIPDAVKHEKNGFLVAPEDVAAMQQYVVEMVEGNRTFSREQIAADAHRQYALSIQAEAYKNLINEVLLK